VTEREFLIDSLRRLNRIEIAYMLTRSMASNHWGIPRTTHDLDFVIQLPSAVVPKLVDEFKGDFLVDREIVERIYRPPHHFNAIDQRSFLKLDFWLLKPEPFDRSMFDRRIRVSYFGEPAWIVTAEDIILQKLFWDKMGPSNQQLNDVAGVIAVQAGTLDLDYLRHWAAELRVRSKLEDVLAGRIKPKAT